MTPDLRPATPSPRPVTPTHDLRPDICEVLKVLPDSCPVLQAGVPGRIPADVATQATTGEGRVRALQREVQGVTSIMTQNVERILARGENLEQLHSKSQDLEATSEHFRTTSQKMARRYWWKNVKLLVILGLVGVIVLVLIILLATGTIPT
ncbi:PREDICTED: vesicle-associated membrane protein 8 [Sturnus vulgaris]|uniref:vesicle-associated membrane protein 8 n=1 Tax=Sturnus vulgaris TaxID=9172 RepID=UPI00071A46D1|nr:PREDICTED: vesicle-associated membrane protein 8 [Sturnus vulgaris]